MKTHQDNGHVAQIMRHNETLVRMLIDQARMSTDFQRDLVRLVTADNDALSARLGHLPHWWVDWVSALVRDAIGVA